MTLIVTHISNYGIIHASDSNLTSSNRYAGEAPKIFKIPHLNSALSVAGSYSVANTSMDIWMKNFIASSEKNILSLKDFANELNTQLENNMTELEKTGSLIHLSGYEKDSNGYHPEFWFIRNLHGIDLTTGEYTDLGVFQLSEDFWNRDYNPNTNNFEQLYFNGFASGRIGFVMIQRTLRNYFNSIWTNSNWNFRPPKTLEEAEIIIKLYIQIIHTLFTISDYPAPFIGGSIQTELIKFPIEQEN